MVSFIIIIILYFVVSNIISNWVPKETLYCYFDRSFDNDVALRNECALFKIITKGDINLNEEDFKNLEVSTDCSENFEDLPTCDGETYHFTKIPVMNIYFCESPPCDVKGLVCGAYYVDYHKNSSRHIQIYESSFTEPNLKTKKELMNKFEECDI